MQADYISSNQFKVSTDKTLEFLSGRRVRANCGGSYKYSTIQSSTYSDPDTTVTIEESILTSNLTEVHYGIVNIGEQGSFPKHSHDGAEGAGGPLSLLILSDTPSVYDNGKYLRSTTSGIEFEDLDDYYYTESEVDTISGSLQTNIDGKSNTDHIHDDRYYTESEVNTISGSLQTNIDTKPDTEVFLVEGVPSNSIGKIDDIAIDQNTGIIYERLSDPTFVATTWNPSDKHADINLSNGNLTVGCSSNSSRGVRSVFGISSGKWYWEITPGTIDALWSAIGIGNSSATLSAQVGDTNGYGHIPTGTKRHNNSSTSYGNSYTTSDVIGVAINMDTGKIWWSKNGVWQGSGDPVSGTNEAFSGISGTFYAMVNTDGSNNVFVANFGATAFIHTVPTGFNAGFGDGSFEGGWSIRLTPDFLKLSDTPSTYSGKSGKYLKTTSSEIEFSDDELYTKSEVDTISGTLQTNIDAKPDTEVFLVEGVPSNSMGKENDIAVNQEIGDIYEKTVTLVPTTWNPDDKSADITLSNGNLTATGKNSVRTIVGKSSGKWYWEVTINTAAHTHNMVGFGTIDTPLNNALGFNVYSYGYHGYNGYKHHNGSSSSYGNAFTTNDIIGVALDLDNGKVWWSKNGVWQSSGDPVAGTNEAYSGLSGTFYPINYLAYTGTNVITANFGASSFSYTVPFGFSAGVGGGVVQWEEKLSPDFLKLSDTPTTYSGVEGEYLKTTSSGIEFSQIALLDLLDTPTTYSGSDWTYVKPTNSGIEFSDDYHFGDDTNYTQIETDGKIHFFGDAQPVNFTVIDSLSCDASHHTPLSFTSLAATNGIQTSGLDTSEGELRRIEVVGIDGGIYVKGRKKGAYSQGDTTHESHRIKIKLNTTIATWEQSGEWRIILDILSGDTTGIFTVFMPAFSMMEYDFLELYVTHEGATYAETTSRGFDVSVAGPSAAEELFSNNETTGSGVVVEVASTTGFYAGNEVFVSDTSNSEWTRIKDVVTDTSITVDLNDSYTTVSGAKFSIFDYTKTTLTEPIQRGLFRAKIFKANENSGVQFQMPVPQQTDPTKDMGIVLQYVSTVDNPGLTMVSKWRVQYFFKTLGEDIPESYQYAELVYADVTPPVTKCNYIATLATITPEVHQGKNLLAMEVVRLGADAGDTYTGNFKLAAIITTMPWKQLGYEA